MEVFPDVCSQQLQENLENKPHKPLAYSPAADVEDGFIPDVALAVRQENYDRRSTMHVSVS